VRAALAVSALLLLGNAAHAQSADTAPKPDAVTLPEWGKGPFEVYDPFITATLRSAPYARSPEPLDHLELQLGARGVWENNFGYGGDLTQRAANGSPLHRFTLDAETRTLDLVARLGLWKRIELGAEFQALEWQGGGVLDPLIRQYHRSTGIGSLDRDYVNNDSFTVSGVDPAGKPFNLGARGTIEGNSALTGRVLALEGSELWPAVAFTLRVWLPTANPRFEHANGTAETLSVDASKRILDLPFVVYGGGAYTYYDEATVDGLALMRHRFMVYGGVEWQITPHFSLVAHVWIETLREKRLFVNTNLPYGNYIQYIAVGAKWEPIDGLTIELGILENILDPNTTGDFGFLLNVWYRFGLDKKSS
jgi:hypothetical protein